MAGIDSLLWGLIQYTLFIIAITFHEAAHALVGWKLGDSTGLANGQVSLNPLVHIRAQPVGTVLMPLISFLMTQNVIGFASVPYNPFWAERYPVRHLWMSLAGPAANFLLFIVSILGFLIGLRMEWIPFEILEINLKDTLLSPVAPAAAKLGVLLYYNAWFNFMLCIFNLIPIPPLDGSSIWKIVLPNAAYRTYQEFTSGPQLLLLGLMIASAIANSFSMKAFMLVLGFLARLILT
jgi:Zn-dependent protease